MKWHFHRKHSIEQNYTELCEQLIVMWRSVATICHLYYWKWPCMQPADTLKIVFKELVPYSLKQMISNCFAASWLDITIDKLSKIFVTTNVDILCVQTQFFNVLATRWNIYSTFPITSNRCNKLNVFLWGSKNLFIYLF